MKQSLIIILSFIVLNINLSSQIIIDCDYFDSYQYGKYIIVSKDSVPNDLYGIIDTSGNYILDYNYTK